MTRDQIAQAIEAKPFEPFTIHMTNGKVFLIKHRDFISLSPTSPIVVVFGESGSAHILDTLLISELEVHPQSKQSENAA